ncbi:MAG: lycopene cyclase domain-containing protein [Anaerolineae bacterium]|jgi:lycopene cyclase domain-containing protein|nr:lycopene cyclase domain-containing protein [Anaerolineae bacterium]
MTYFTFLAIFLGIPMALLSFITIRDYRRGKWVPAALHAWRPWVVILALCLVALIYTTPWDNYLVATGVWWYDPALVTGIVIGWVPIEEYTFFIVLPIFTGLFALLLMRYLPINPVKADSVRIRVVATAVTFLVWVASVVLLVLTFVNPEQFKPGTYLALELSWALIPILIQLAFGADILWRHRGIVFGSIFVTTFYLCVADFIAIDSGTWTIDPAQSLQWYIGGVLPIEEVVFFLIVNVLVVMGLVLVQAEESQARAIALTGRYQFLRPVTEWMKRQPQVAAASTTTTATQAGD